MKQKILTQEQVVQLGLDKVSVITADMLEGYTSIGNYAFYDRSSLASVTIPNSVTNIGKGVFYNCTGLTSITIPNSVTSIGDGAFYGCSGLTSVTIPNSVTSIGNYAFYDCSSLASVTIPNSVTSIGYAAFFGCSGLTSVTIPNSVTSIGDGAFYGCYRLTSITMPNSVTNIGKGVFYNCTGLTSITIPNSVTFIGDSAFYNCYRLASVTIGDKTYKTQTVTNGKCKAYKGFNADMTCRDFQYEEGKTYVFKGEPKLCKRGFHASLSLSDVFNYYYGDIDKDMIVCEVELEGVSDERNEYDSKVVAKKITIGKRIYKRMNDTFERVVKTVASYEHNGERVIIHDLDETFYADLGLDSLAVVESVMLCEGEFGVTFTDDEITRMNTVSDLVNLIDKKLENTIK